MSAYKGVSSRWGERVLAMVEHGVRIACSEAAWFLGVEVEEDSIGFPVTEGTDGSLVNTRNEEGGSSTGSEAVGFDAFQRDVSDVVDSSSSMAQFVGDVMSSDVVWRVGVVIVVIKGAVG